MTRPGSVTRPRGQAPWPTGRGLPARPMGPGLQPRSNGRGLPPWSTRAPVLPSATPASAARRPPPHLLRPLHVERALPTGDREDGDAVAEEVGRDAHRVHDAVHAEEEGDGSGGDDTERGGRRRQSKEGGTRHTRHALAGQHENQDDSDLLTQAQIHTHRLRDEQRTDRQVDRGAVKVEGVAGGQDQAHGVVAAARLAQLLHHARHDGLAGGGTEREQHLLAGLTCSPC